MITQELLPPPTQSEPQTPRCALAICSARLVSAAMLMDDGLIVAGVRHYSPDMRATMGRIYGSGLRLFGRWLRKPYHLRVKEQGFIDTRGNFLTRNEAYNRVLQNCQVWKFIGCRVPDTTTELYSEDLY